MCNLSKKRCTKVHSLYKVMLFGDVLATEISRPRRRLHMLKMVADGLCKGIICNRHTV